MANEQPTMMTIREVARTGILSEHALRTMQRRGELPSIYVGNRVLINYEKLCEQLSQIKSADKAKQAPA